MVIQTSDGIATDLPSRGDYLSQLVVPIGVMVAVTQPHRPYRAYGVILLVLTVWSTVWMGTGLDMALAPVGMDWFLLNLYGAVVVLALMGFPATSPTQAYTPQST